MEPEPQSNIENSIDLTPTITNPEESKHRKPMEPIEYNEKEESKEKLS